MSKKKPKAKFEVEMEFGSEFQEECGLQILTTTLEAIRIHFEGRHKGNKITWKKVE